jgi:hypothetical protein
MRCEWLIAAAALAAASFPALAQDQPRRDWPSAAQRWTPQNPPCTCRAQGRDFLVGEMVCLSTAFGARLATCSMALNNTSWDVGEAPCTTSAPPGRAETVASK